MEPPPNIWEFDRYARHTKSVPTVQRPARVRAQDVVAHSQSVLGMETEVGSVIRGPVRPLTCPGLTLRKHPLTSTPTYDSGVFDSSHTP